MLLKSFAVTSLDGNSKIVRKIAKQIIMILAGISLVFTAYTQKITVKGTVTEAETGEPLALVSVTVSSASKKWHEATNQHGYFQLTIEREATQVLFSQVGHEPYQVTISKDTLLIVRLKRYTLQEVEVKTSYQPASSPNLVSISPSRLNQLPNIGGEKDIIKAIGTLPGVSAGSELSSGINVRGGANDQNLFYLDGAPIYSTGHLFNFLSLFNADAIQRVNFYKGEFPVEFGGRLSSVTDVIFREGDKNRWQGKIDVGLITAKFSLEGPIKKDKTSLLLTGRSAYLNLFNKNKKQEILNHQEGNFLGYNFYDINFKINHAFNQKHKLFFSYYRGVDNYESLQNSFNGTNYDQNIRRLTNQLVSVRSYHILGNRLFLQTGIHLTQYAFRYNEGGASYKVTISQPQPWILPETIRTKISENFKHSTGQVKDISANVLADWSLSDKSKIKFGSDLIRHHYTPISYRRQSLNDDSLLIKEPTSWAWEGATFGNYSLAISSAAQLTIGGRFSYFRTQQSSYHGLEPRFSFNYNLSKANVQLSATRMMQYNHALMKTGGLTDKVIWVPSTSQIGPQSSWQYTASWSQSASILKYSIGAYFKQMQNLSMYNDYYGNEYLYYQWEKNTLSNGKGKSYGLELALEKNYRRWTASLNYTLSWNKRRFENWNNGDWFNHLYDRRHILNINGVFKINKTTQLSFLWMYYTGQRYDLPVGRVLGNPLVPEYVVYDKINDGKFPDYHRLDISFTKQYLLKRERYIEVNATVFNAYNRSNAYRMYPSEEVIRNAKNQPIDRKKVIKSVAIFPVLPSINIAYKFK